MKKKRKYIGEAVQRYKPILAFLNDCEIDEIENEPTNEVYKRYTVFCAENSMTPMGNVIFTKQVCKRLGLMVIQKRINGEKKRIYVKDE